MEEKNVFISDNADSNKIIKIGMGGGKKKTFISNAAVFLKFKLNPIYVKGYLQEVSPAVCLADKTRRLFGYHTECNRKLLA